MAYGGRYTLSFVSDRENDYRIEVLQQGYTGAAMVKKLGGAPTLSIEEGDGRIKGSSLAFSIQADAEGELSGLYTTNNKEFKVLLYRNGALYWQGYILPELYSENYVDPPYDVAVTATDQLATLKEIAYQGEDAQVQILEIAKGILLQSQVDIPCRLHMQIDNAAGVSVLKGAYINASAFNGLSCYDALNAILLSCNCCILQMANEWLITSLTDTSTTYETESGSQEKAHCTLGQMGDADVCPDGSLSMVNAPALKGVTLNYNHILNNSLLKNADCTSRDGWLNTLPDGLEVKFPTELEIAGQIYKCHCWSLPYKDLLTDSALQVWQEISVRADDEYSYSLSVDYQMVRDNSTLLVAIVHVGIDGVTRRLTDSGWSTTASVQAYSSYITVTGNDTYTTVMGLANSEQYERATIKFNLPPVAGTLRIGFINSNQDKEWGDWGAIYITKIYLSVLDIAGSTSTSLVEVNATGAQEEIGLVYGDGVASANADKLVLNTLRDAAGGKIAVWSLAGQSYDSYFLAMLQDLSRYMGVKKVQLQGSVMGTDVLHPLYKDVFSGKVLRLLNGQYNLLEDSMSVVLEEVPSAFVDYDVVVYAADNKTGSPSQTSASGGGVPSVGENYLTLQADGDVLVKGERPLSGKEARFENVALPSAAPERTSDRTYIYSSEPGSLPSVDIAGVVNDVSAIDKRVVELESLGLSLVTENGVTYLRSSYNFFSKSGVSSGGPGGSSSGSGGSSGGGLSSVTVKLGTVAYQSVDGVVSLPAYPTSLANPYALTINNSAGTAQVAYDGSAAKALTLTKAMVGLGNVENTALSTWAGSSKITTLGTITTGVWNGTKIANAYLANSAITINGTSTSLGGSFSTASITAGTAGTSSATSGYTLSVPYVTVSKYGIVTGYGTHTHTINSIPNSSLVNSSVTISGTAVSLGGSITQAALRTALGLGSNAYTSTAYLPLSGGVINGGYDALQIQRDGGNYASVIKYRNSVKVLGCLGFNSNGEGILLDGNGSSQKIIIHSGNYDSYAVKYIGGASVDSARHSIGYDNASRGSVDLPMTGGFISADQGSYGFQLIGSNAGTRVMFRGLDNNTPTSWVEILHANNISSYNAGSATKLQTARTIWGQSFDGTGNISGNLYMSNDRALQIYDTGGTARVLLYYNSANQLFLGYGSAAAGSDTYIEGNNIRFRYSESHTAGMILNSSGNVGIGTTSPSYKLHVNGIIGTDSWFYNTAADFGLYNVAGDARWRYVSASDCWTADKSIETTKYYFAFSNIAGSSWGYGVGALNVNIADNAAQTPLIVAMRRGENPATAGSTRLFAMELLNSGATMRWYFGSTNAYSFSSGGNFYAAGGITSAKASDRRLKKNILNITEADAVNVLRALRPVTFRWNELAGTLDSRNSGVSGGFIADEYERLIPNSGRNIWDKYRAIDYDRAIPYLSRGWQIHDRVLVRHDERIETVEEKLKKAEARIAELENQLNEYRRA